MMNPAEFANIAKCEKDLWWYRGMRAIFFRMLTPYLHGRTICHALEAGCGTGYFSHLLQVEHKLPVAPMDLSWDGLSYARSMGAERLVQGNIMDLPFRANAFDLVLSMDVLPHMRPGEEQIPAREMARVLAPGGLVVIRSAALDILSSRHSQFVLERQRFTRRRLMGLMAGVGIRPLRCTYANSLLMPIALAKFRVWEPLMRQPAASGVENVAPWLDSLLYSALAVEAAWIGAGYNFPAGQSLVFIGEKIV
jgi:SAM-dependent methyltransferase